MNIKTFYIFIWIFILVIQFIHRAHSLLSPRQLEKLGNTFRRKCLIKTGADLEEVKGIRDGKFVATDESTKCYTKCVMELMQTLVRKGKRREIDIELMVKQNNLLSPPEVAERVIPGLRKCHEQIKDRNPCELAWRFVQCAYEDHPDDFFFS